MPLAAARAAAGGSHPGGDRPTIGRPKKFPSSGGVAPPCGGGAGPARTNRWSILGLPRARFTFDERSRLECEPGLGREHHDHMICVMCGGILEFLQPAIERLQADACRKHGFRPLDHTLQIQGVCAARSASSG